MNKTTRKYFINVLLIVFSWFFLVEPWFAFTSKQASDKLQYKDASKNKPSFDSATYFRISKDDSDTDEVDFEKETLAFLNSCVFVAFFFNEINFSTPKIHISNAPPVSSVGLCILNKVIRI